MRQFQLTSVTTSVDAADLHPYYTYTITVSAVTIGEGPYSSAISLQTLEDGKHCTMYCSLYTFHADTCNFKINFVPIITSV